MYYKHNYYLFLLLFLLFWKLLFLCHCNIDIAMVHGVSMHNQLAIVQWLFYCRRCYLAIILYNNYNYYLVIIIKTNYLFHALERNRKRDNTLLQKKNYESLGDKTVHVSASSPLSSHFYTMAMRKQACGKKASENVESYPTGYTEKLVER